jgi:hypothetical protein
VPHRLSKDGVWLSWQMVALYGDRAAYGSNSGSSSSNTSSRNYGGRVCTQAEQKRFTEHLTSHNRMQRSQ